MPSAPTASASARNLLAHRPFLLFVGARGFSTFAYQIATVAIGWQVYALTNSAFALGMVGLTQFIPSALLVFIAGHVADRYDRKRVVQVCQCTEGLAAVFLAWGNYAKRLNVIEIFAAVAVIGIAKAFESPAASALLPGVTPEGMLQKGTAIASAVFQMSVITGPAIGGFAYAVAPGVPYLLMALSWLMAGTLNGAIQLDRAITSKEPATLDRFLAGVRFVRHNPAILGTISLDMFAVLLGGATALLPIYARDILHTGPWGLGLLRAMPAVGALLMTVMLARRSIQRRVGMRMFQAVILFGVATVVFAVSHRIWLSLLALSVMGAADMVSVVIRSSLVQLATPDEMRGRVGAVNFLFINASNQLGEFESGITASWFGTIPAAFLGGAGTIVVALLWMKLFPALRHVERLE
jgi:MFS family permease